MEYLMMKDIEHSKVTPFISYSPTPHKGVLTRGQDSKSLRRIDLESWPCVNTLYSAWEVDSCKHVWRQPWGAEAPEVHLLMTNMWSMKKSWEGTIRKWDTWYCSLDQLLLCFWSASYSMQPERQCIYDQCEFLLGSHLSRYCLHKTCYLH